MNRYCCGDTRGCNLLGPKSSAPELIPQCPKVLLEMGISVIMVPQQVDDVLLPFDVFRTGRPTFKIEKRPPPGFENCHHEGRARKPYSIAAQKLASPNWRYPHTGEGLQLWVVACPRTSAGDRDRRAAHGLLARHDHRGGPRAGGGTAEGRRWTRPPRATVAPEPWEAPREVHASATGSYSSISGVAPNPGAHLAAGSGRRRERYRPSPLRPFQHRRE